MPTLKNKNTGKTISLKKLQQPKPTPKLPKGTKKSRFGAYG